MLTCIVGEVVSAALQAGMGSSFSGGGNCVEIALGGEISVRHSARHDEATLVFTREEWDAFIEGVKAGEFDPA